MPKQAADLDEPAAELSPPTIVRRA